ncbi:hypothetical protein C2S52_008989 [Perilla frutescens var. hirtella]|nr:hypothetical protein C2S52_008989 [Perilla frutescens var. hirtella]
MSRKEDDNRESLQVKREKIWQLCHEEDSSSSDRELSLPVSLGSFGITGALEFGITECFGKGTKAVIKSLDTVNLTEEEFEQQMISLRSCRHENVGIPWGYYLSQTTKLVVYDHYSQGSVFDMLHGEGSNSRPNWERRLRMAVGAARGIAHIHAQGGGKLFHGNIKSSNIFLNRQEYGCVSDFGLKIIKNDEEEIIQKSDVYNMGLVLLELVTRHRVWPMQTSYIVDHLRSFEPYEWDLHCFDQPEEYVDELDMMQSKYKFPFLDSELIINADINSSVHHQLVKTLLLAKTCLAHLPEHRPTMSDVAFMLASIHTN